MCASSSARDPRRAAYPATSHLSVTIYSGPSGKPTACPSSHASSSCASSSMLAMETLRTASGNVTLARDACFPASWIRRISALADVARLCTDIGQPLGLEAVFLVVPLEWADFAALGGYARLLDPTLRTVQEGQLREVTARMAAVVFPAVQPVSAGTRVRLGRRRDG